MAVAAKAASKQVFQVGHLYRSEPTHRSVFQFIRSGALGKPVMARAQWHTKQSWRRASPNQERERAQNWRLDADVSTGLIGEVGLQQLDMAFWIMQALPTSVTGAGQVMLWDDGREVPDTIQTIFAFPNEARLIYDATLASSFDGEYDLYFGSASTIMLRDSKAWMFKEVDAPMLGWEVYARKDTFYKEQGIALVANATQLDAQNQDPAADDPNVETPLWYALKEFMDNINFGPYPPSAGYQEGYQAAVVAIKAHEAIMQNTTITFEDAWFNLT
jgi:predicted dehydrogenase